MTSYVNAELRRTVKVRADHVCEYCLIHEDDTVFGCQVDHIIAKKHGGATDADNLSFACTFCNRSKGSDIGAVAPSSGEYVRFFNPRLDRWGEHFALHDNFIVPRTPIGEATAKILGFNVPERVVERESLQIVGRYPPSQATQHFD